MMDLGEYLKEFAARQWRWGEADCCVFVSEWAVSTGRADPMGNLRGAYSTRAEAQAIIDDAGGMGALLDTRLTRVGMERIKRNDAREGDIAVCSAPDEVGKMTDIAAIWTGRRWAFFSDRGLVCLDPSSVKVRGRWR